MANKKANKLKKMTTEKENAAPLVGVTHAGKTPSSGSSTPMASTSSKTTSATTTTTSNSQNKKRKLAGAAEDLPVSSFEVELSNQASGELQKGTTFGVVDLLVDIE